MDTTNNGLEKSSIFQMSEFGGIQFMLKFQDITSPVPQMYGSDGIPSSKLQALQACSMAYLEDGLVLCAKKRAW